MSQTITPNSKPVVPTPRAGEMSLERLTHDLIREMAAWREQSVQETRRQAEQEAKRDQEAIVSALLLLHELQGTLAKQQDNPAAMGRSAQDLLRRSLQCYAEAGYIAEDFTGLPLSDELRERLEVAGYRYHEADEDRVSETVVPEISKNGRVLRYGVIIGASKDAREGSGA